MAKIFHPLASVDRLGNLLLTSAQHVGKGRMSRVTRRDAQGIITATRLKPV